MPLTLMLLATALLCTAQAIRVVPRVVGGYPETNRTVIRWQALILRDGECAMAHANDVANHTHRPTQERCTAAARCCHRRKSSPPPTATSRST